MHRIGKACEEAPVVWLAGDRRARNTNLTQAFGADRAHYLNCDLPIVANMVGDPDLFYRNLDKKVVFDEVHQLPDPSKVLKTGADLFPHIKI